MVINIDCDYYFHLTRYKLQLTVFGPIIDRVCLLWGRLQESNSALQAMSSYRIDLLYSYRTGPRSVPDATYPGI